MNGIDLLTYLLTFAFLGLLSYALQKIAQWQRQQQEAQERGVEPEKQAERPRRIADVGERIAEIRAVPGGRALLPDHLIRVGARPSPVRALLAGRSNLRQAMVIATVLGPCRAQEPHAVGR